MKIRRFAIIAVMLTACILGGCQEKNGERVEETAKISADWNPDYRTASYYQFVTESERGYYIAAANFLYYLEEGETEPVILCNKPNCIHNGAECNAYFPQSFSQITYSDGRIYGFTEDYMTFEEQLVAVSADGETKEVLMDVDNRDQDQFILHRGSVYYIRQGTDSVSLMRYHLEEKTEEEILRQDGGAGGIGYLFAWKDGIYIPITVYEGENAYPSMRRYDIEDGSLSEFYIEDEQTGEEMEDLMLIGAEEDYLTVVAFPGNTEKNPVYVCGLEGGKAKKGLSLPIGGIVTDGDYIFSIDLNGGCCVIYNQDGTPMNQFDGWQGKEYGFIASGSREQAFMIKNIEENGVLGEGIYILDKTLIGTEDCRFEEIIRRPYILGESFQ